MSFPTPYTVIHTPHVGMGEDGMGNDVPLFGAPIERPVYGWQPHLVETLGGYTSRVEAEVDLLMPKVAVSMLDTFVVDGLEYEVAEIQDYTYGFHGWKPGIVVLLRRITGG